MIKSLDKIEKTNLIKEAILKVNLTGAVLISIAFGGLPTNFAACEVLGASFNLDDFKPYFPNPESKKRICIAHMLKLARNCSQAKFRLIDRNDNIISWVFFEKLL